MPARPALCSGCCKPVAAGPGEILIRLPGGVVPRYRRVYACSAACWERAAREAFAAIALLLAVSQISRHARYSWGALSFTERRQRAIHILRKMVRSERR